MTLRNTGFRLLTAERPSGSTMNIRDRLRARLAQRTSPVSSTPVPTSSDTIPTPDFDNHRVAVLAKSSSTSGNVYVVSSNYPGISDYASELIGSGFGQCGLAFIDPALNPLLVNEPISVRCDGTMVNIYEKVNNTDRVEAESVRQCLKERTTEACNSRDNSGIYFLLIATACLLAAVSIGACGSRRRRPAAPTANPTPDALALNLGPQTRTPRSSI